MADLRPIGSEKLEGSDKLRRIMEIANYGKSSNLNESSSSSEYTIQLADGNYYGIVKEKSGYIVKSGINESELDYIDPMKNRKYHNSYSQAMKKINLIAGELNRLHENVEGINLIGEQKKFVLKTPKPAEPEVDASVEMDVPAPAPDAAPEGGEDMSMDMSMDAAPEGGEEMDMSMDMDTPEGGEEMDMSMDMDTPEEGDDDEEMSFKTIQKLTGKLGQKLRTFDSSQGMSSENIKYVLNSILSALDLSKLTEEDYDDIMSKFEEDEDEIDYGVEDEADIDVEAGDEMMDLDMDIESDVEPEMGEMKEYFYDDMDLGDGEKSKFDRDRYALHQYDAGWFDEDDRRMDDFEDYDEEIEFGPEDYEKFLELSPENARWNPKMDKHYYDTHMKNQLPLKLRIKRAMGEGAKSYEKTMDEIFSESKIEKVLSKYFVVSEEEQKMNKDRDVKKYITERVKNSLVRKEIKNLSESVEQELTSDFIIKEHNTVKFIGKTNKGNLVFEADGKTIKVSSNGEIL